MPCWSRKNEAKISDDVEANKQYPSKETENRFEDLEKKFDEKFDAMERKLIVYVYTIIEDKQSFEAYEKKIDILEKKMDAMENKMMEKLEGLSLVKEKLDGGKQ